MGVQHHEKSKGSRESASRMTAACQAGERRAFTLVELPRGDPDHPPGQRCGTADGAPGDRPPSCERGGSSRPGRTRRRPRCGNSQQLTERCPAVPRPRRFHFSTPRSTGSPRLARPTSSRRTDSSQSSLALTTAKGLINITSPSFDQTNGTGPTVPYPLGPPVGTIPIPYPGSLTDNVLMIEESVYDPHAGPTAVPNPPTSWFWNIRVGDKIQVNNSGDLYTVVGPMVVAPWNGNPEMFVNLGLPGAAIRLDLLPDAVVHAVQAQHRRLRYQPEFLFVVNGQDDNGNGLVDEGWNGIDDNLDGIRDNLPEWEPETWLGSIGNTLSTITINPVTASPRHLRADPESILYDHTETRTIAQRAGDRPPRERGDRPDLSPPRQPGAVTLPRGNHRSVHGACRYCAHSCAATSCRPRPIPRRRAWG